MKYLMRIHLLGAMLITFLKTIASIWLLGVQLDISVKIAVFDVKYNARNDEVMVFISYMLHLEREFWLCHEEESILYNRIEIMGLVLSGPESKQKTKQYRYNKGKWLSQHYLISHFYSSYSLRIWPLKNSSSISLCSFSVSTVLSFKHNLGNHFIHLKERMHSLFHNSNSLQLKLVWTVDSLVMF